MSFLDEYLNILYIINCNKWKIHQNLSYLLRDLPGLSPATVLAIPWSQTPGQPLLLCRWEPWCCFLCQVWNPFPFRGSPLKIRKPLSVHSCIGLCYLYTTVGVSNLKIKINGIWIWIKLIKTFHYLCTFQCLFFFAVLAHIHSSYHPVKSSIQNLLFIILWFVIHFYKKQLVFMLQIITKHSNMIALKY